MVRRIAAWVGRVYGRFVAFGSGICRSAELVSVGLARTTAVVCPLWALVTGSEPLSAVLWGLLVATPLALAGRVFRLRHVERPPLFPFRTRQAIFLGLPPFTSGIVALRAGATVALEWTAALGFALVVWVLPTLAVLYGGYRVYRRRVGQ